MESRINVVVPVSCFLPLRCPDAAIHGAEKMSLSRGCEGEKAFSENLSIIAVLGKSLL